MARVSDASGAGEQRDLKAELAALRARLEEAQGYLRLDHLRERRAELEKEVVVVGVGDRLELWDRGRWNDHRPTLLSGVAEITARVDHPA